MAVNLGVEGELGDYYTSQVLNTLQRKKCATGLRFLYLYGCVLDDYSQVMRIFMYAIIV